MKIKKLCLTILFHPFLTNLHSDISAFLGQPTVVIITAESQEVTRNSVKSHVQCESKIQRCPFKSTEVMSHTCCLQIINLFSHLAVRTRLNRVHRLLLTDLPVIEKPACTQ